MSTIPNNDRISEESVIVILDENKAPIGFVRRDTNGHSGIPFFYSITRMGYADLKEFLIELTRPAEAQIKS